MCASEILNDKEAHEVKMSFYLVIVSKGIYYFKDLLTVYLLKDESLLPLFLLFIIQMF